MDFSIQTVLNDKLNEGREKKEIKSWHPSKLGSCLTGVYLERLGLPPDVEFDHRTLRVFSVGKMMEDWLVGLIENKIKVDKQVRIEWEEMNMSGYADLVVHIGDERLPYEIKSKHSKAFWYMDKKGEGASRHNQMQLWTYLKVLGLPEGRLIYLSKDDLAILEYPVFLNDKELERDVMKELTTLNRAWKEKLPPRPPSDPKDWRCTYCRWHKQCVAQQEYLEE